MKMVKAQKTKTRRRQTLEKKIVPPSRKIALVVTKYKMGQEPNDFAYWQTRSYAERISTLEELRNAYILGKYGTRQRLQRVYRVVKQK